MNGTLAAMLWPTLTVITALASTRMTLREKKLSSLTSQKHLMRLVQLSFELNLPAERGKERSLGTKNITFLSVLAMLVSSRWSQIFGAKGLHVVKSSCIAGADRLHQQASPAFICYILCMSHFNIALRLCAPDGMNRLCNVHYEHSVPKAKSVKGLRLALVFRQGNIREIDQDSGIPVNGLSSLHLPGRFFGHPHHRKIGEICIVEGGGLYSRKDLLQSGAHCFDRRGVDGNKDCGVCAIVVSRQDKKKGEGDGLKWLTYTSTVAQGAKAMLTSCLAEKPIRVFRSSMLNSAFSPPAPVGGSTSYRYDGLYAAKGIVNDKGSVVKPGNLQAENVEHTFYLERLPSRGEAMAHAEEPSEFYNSLSVSRLWEEIQSMSDNLQPKKIERTTKEKKSKYVKRMPFTMRKPRVYVSKPGRRQVAVEEVGLPVLKKDSGGGAAGWIVENNVVCDIEDSGICEGRLVANKMESEDAMILSTLNTGVGDEDKLLLLKLADSGDSKLAHYFQSRRSFRLYRSSKLNSPFAPNPSEEGSIRDDGFYSVTEVRNEDGNFVDESDFNPLEDNLYWFIVERLDHASPDGFGSQNLLSAERLWESIRRDASRGTSDPEHPSIKAYGDRDESDRYFCFDSIPRFSKRRKMTKFE